MQPPIKPWENGGLNRYPPHFNGAGQPTGMLSGSPLLHSSSPNIPMHLSNHLGQTTQATSTVQNPPPLPRRVGVNHSLNQSAALRSRLPMSLVNGNGYGLSSPLGGYGSYGGYGGYSGYGSYGGLGSYGMGGYGGYSSYGGYGMNRYSSPNPNDPESMFIQLAEESSRPAFQSIESLVQAFHSVSMMLDSTFNAVYTSFRAVLGVAENFGRLRTLLGQFFSSVALFRAFIWLYKKVLYILGLRRENPSQDQLWQAAIQEAGEDLAASSGRPRSSWPILMFMGIVFSGPYLIFKLISSLNNSAEAPRKVSWDPEKMPGTPVVAVFGFTARSDDELSFYPGQRIIVAPVSFQRKELQGWLLAKVDGSPQIGLVPFNYIAAATQTPKTGNSAVALATEANKKEDLFPKTIPTSLPNELPQSLTSESIQQESPSPSVPENSNK